MGRGRTRGSMVRGKRWSGDRGMNKSRGMGKGTERGRGRVMGSLGQWNERINDFRRRFDVPESTSSRTVGRGISRRGEDAAFDALGNPICM